MKLYSVIQTLDFHVKKTFVCNSILEDTMNLYNNLKKITKSHWSVLDRNRKDVNDIELENALNQRLAANKNVVNEKEVRLDFINLLVPKMNSM